MSASSYAVCHAALPITTVHILKYPSRPPLFSMHIYSFLCPAADTLASNTPTWRYLQPGREHQPVHLTPQRSIPPEPVWNPRLGVGSRVGSIGVGQSSRCLDRVQLL